VKRTITGSLDHTTAKAPEHVEIELKDKMSTSPTIDILERSLLDSPLPYTVAAAAKVNRKQQRWMDRKVNKMKAAFRRPEIGDLKHKLLTLDISTNKYVHTTSHTIPLNEKAYHPTLGMIVATHPDMRVPDGSVCVMNNLEQEVLRVEYSGLMRVFLNARNTSC
jgi:hypothetical protein